MITNLGVSVDKLCQLGFSVDRVFYDMYEEKIILMSKRSQTGNTLIEVDSQGLVCGLNINEFINNQ